MRSYAKKQAARLLRKLNTEVARTSAKGDPDSIHDLRVAIRRFSQSLRIFEDLFAAGKARKTRRQLKKLMSMAGEIRNRDIALDLVQQAGVHDGAALRAELQQERADAWKQLSASLRRRRKQRSLRKSRQRLSL